MAESERTYGDRENLAGWVDELIAGRENLANQKAKELGRGTNWVSQSARAGTAKADLLIPWVRALGGKPLEALVVGGWLTREEAYPEMDARMAEPTMQEWVETGIDLSPEQRTVVIQAMRVLLPLLVQRGKDGQAA